MTSIFSRVRAGFLLLLTSLILVGCGNSNDFVFTNTNNAVATGSNTLTVNLNTAAPVNPRIIDDAVTFLVQVFDANTVLVNQTTINRGQDAVFANLPNGSYIIRVLGRDGNSNPIGYFDRSLSVSGPTTVAIDALIYATAPTVGTQTQPFLAISELPDQVTVGSPFTIVVSAYNADGSLNTAKTGSVALTANGGTFLTAPTDTAFSSGRASFPGLQLAPAPSQTVTFTGTSDAQTATSLAIPTVDLSPNFLAVGNYDGDTITIYNISNLAAGNNNLAPSVTVTGDPTNAYSMASTPDGAGLFFANSGSAVQYFSNIKAGGNQTATSNLRVVNTCETVAYDGQRDIVYTNDATSVACFDGAKTLANGSFATRSVTGFTGNIISVEYDPATDRLFVTDGDGTPNTFRLHIFNNASTLTGDQTQITHVTRTVLSEQGLVGFSYDATHDRLWFGDFNNAINGCQFLDAVSTGTGDLTPNSLLQMTVAHPYIYDTAYDPFRDRLYLACYSIHEVWIYDHASQITGQVTNREPDFKIVGAATMLSGPDGITLIR